MKNWVAKGIALDVNDFNQQNSFFLTAGQNNFWNKKNIVVGFLKIIHSLFCEKLEISSEFVTLFELGICIIPNPDYPWGQGNIGADSAD